jgi:FAD synthetase
MATLENPDKLDEDTFRSSLALYRKMEACKDDELSPVLARAIEICRSGLRLFGPQRLITSYNGGKDAVVIMQLHRAVMAQYSLEVGRIHRPRAIYFNITHEFPEVREFVFRTSAQHGLDLAVYNSSFVEGLRRCMDEGEAGSYGFILGTRKGDPNCGAQQAFSPSSDWMPPFMRVNPIIEWDYGQVWRFLRTFDLAYPALYDRGYTSLGSTQDTFPNPALATEGGAYLPAYALQDWTLERAGRGEGNNGGNSNSHGEGIACDVSLTQAQGQGQGFRVRQARTAGLVIIGDEILKGKCCDTNTAFAARKLWSKGIVVQHVAVVQDDHNEIVEEVRRQVEKYDVVFTSGGVGPTHDDVTIHAVAESLGQQLQPNKDMIRLLRENLGLSDSQQLTGTQEKMTMLPEQARLRIPPEDGQVWPILQCENVFILPGVPQFFEKKMAMIVDHFLQGHALSLAKIVLREDEFSIVHFLNQAVAKHTSVTFGSYPFVDKPGYKTIITLEAVREEDVKAAATTLQQLLPPDSIVSCTMGDNVLTSSAAVDG